MQRLHQSSEIASIFSKTKPQYIDNFQIYKITNNLEDNRLGIIISKKYVPLAVNRNRLKRQIRELFRKNIIVKSDKYDILVLVRTKIISQNKADYLHQLHQYINNLS